MRLLMLTYHYPPLQVTASARAAAWAKYLPMHGIDVTVLTYDWPGQHDDSGAARVIRLPAGRMPDHTRLPLPWRIPLVSKAATVLAYRSGNFDYHAAEQAQTMWRYIEEHLQRKDYDLVLGIYNPHFHLRHAAEIERRFGIPFVIDFRDLFNNRIATSRSDQPYRLNYLERLVLRSWKRWMHRAAGFTSVSTPLTEVLSNWFNCKGETVMNGYDPGSFPDVQPPQTPFTTLHSGTLYTTQDLQPFLEGYAAFARGKSDLLLEFRGVTAVMYQRIEDAMNQYAPEVVYALHPRGSREANLHALRASHVLFFPGHRNVRGMYSSKVFEFLASERPLLLAPDDDDVLADLLRPFEGCSLHPDSASVTSTLEMWYMRYREAPHPPLLRRNTEHLTRESQAAQMAAYLHRVYGEINQRNEA